MSSSTPPLLQVSSLHVHLGGRDIVQDVSFSLTVGERVGIIGPNGSGKTTLFNSLSGFLPVSAGSITFREREISTLPPHRRAQLGLGRVFQNFGIFREMSVFENMLLAVESNRKIPKRRRQSTVAEYLDLVDLLEKQKDKAGSLSGGQMRLLEIARTLAVGAELLLLDEPTAGVSPKLKDSVRNLLVHASDNKRTIVVIEHDMGFIGQLCDRILVLDVGRLVLDGPPDEIRSSQKVHEIYFGDAHA
ncbi:MAG: ABC transporter ATP-binding protein [Bdellovibrionales bacterium]|nr:ABC transporter ATP-binding protein [Bdellovibrionales bacterium]